MCERDNDFAAPTISPLDDDSVDGDVRITETPLFNGTPTYSHCPHILTLFIVPESIHFLAYVYLFYHYRIRETEQLSALIETVWHYQVVGNGDRHAETWIHRQMDRLPDWLTDE